MSAGLITPALSMTVDKDALILMVQYFQINSPAGSATFLSDFSGLQKARADNTVYSQCSRLLSLSSEFIWSHCAGHVCVYSQIKLQVLSLSLLVFLSLLSTPSYFHVLSLVSSSLSFHAALQLLIASSCCCARWQLKIKQEIEVQSLKTRSLFRLKGLALKCLYLSID